MHFGWCASRRIDMVIGNCRICSHRLDPSLAAEPVHDPIIRRLMRLRYEQPLFPKGREELGLPEPSVEVNGLAVARPVLVRSWKRKIELIEHPGRQMM